MLLDRSDRGSPSQSMCLPSRIGCEVFTLNYTYRRGFIFLPLKSRILGGFYAYREVTDQQKGTYIMPKQVIHQKKYYIPKAYKEAVEYALRIYHSTDRFNQAVDISHQHFNTKQHPLDRNTLSRHLIKRIANS